MELAVLVSIVRKRWVVAFSSGALVVLLVVGLGAGVKPPVLYEVSAEIAFSGALIELDHYAIDGEVQASRVAASFAATAQSLTVLSAVRENLRLDEDLAEIAERVDATTISSGIVRVTVGGEDLVPAEELLSEILEVTENATTATAPSAENGELIVTRAALGSPAVMERTSSTGMAKIALLAAFAGVAMAVGAAWVRHVCGSRIVIVEDADALVAERKRAALLAPPVIRVVASDLVDEPAARTVRDILLTEVPDGGGLRGAVTLVLMPDRLLNFVGAFASTWAATGRKTILLEVVRGPVDGPPGDALDKVISQVDQPERSSHVRISSGGREVSDYLASPEFAAMLDKLRSMFVQTVIHGGPLAEASVLKVLAAQADSVVVVCDEGTSKVELRSALVIVPDGGRSVVLFQS